MKENVKLKAFTSFNAPAQLKEYTPSSPVRKYLASPAGYLSGGGGHLAAEEASK